MTLSPQLSLDYGACTKQHLDCSAPARNDCSAPARNARTLQIQIWPSQKLPSSQKGLSAVNECFFGLFKNKNKTDWNFQNLNIEAKQKPY